MTIEIPPDLQQFVHNMVDTGCFKDETEVVGEAIRLLQERQRRIEDLRRDIQPALDQLDRGEGIKINSEEELRLFFDDIQRHGRQRYDEAKQKRQ